MVLKYFLGGLEVPLLIWEVPLLICEVPLLIWWVGKMNSRIRLTSVKVRVEVEAELGKRSF